MIKFLGVFVQLKDKEKLKEKEKKPWSRCKAHLKQVLLLAVFYLFIIKIYLTCYSLK